jgi:hypothetical protein
MKKLFVLGSFLVIFLFFFGCQSESPVAPVQNTDGVSTLQKPSPGFSVEYFQNYENEGPYVIGTWGSYGGAKGFIVKYRLQGESDYTQDGETYNSVRKGYTINSTTNVTKLNLHGTYEFMLEALNNQGNTIGSWSMDVEIP